MLGVSLSCFLHLHLSPFVLGSPTSGQYIDNLDRRLTGDWDGFHQTRESGREGAGS